MIWSPVGGGKLLTGDDERTRKIRAVLTEIAAREGLAGPARRPWPSLRAIRRRGVPIVGSGKRERVDGAIKAVNTVMDPQDWYAIVTETSETLEL